MGRNFVPYSRGWWKRATELAFGYCPNIYPCAKCGYPVMKGYCCTGCGTDAPEDELCCEKEER